MSLPFWRTVPTKRDDLDSLDTDAINVITSKTDSVKPWAWPRINDRTYPGVWVCTDAPDLTLHEVFAKAENKDAQVRRVLGLKAPEFTFEVTLLDDVQWQAWQLRQSELLPVEKADGRAEVKHIAHPDVNCMGVHYAYVKSIKPTKNPRAGGAKVLTVIFRAWWPAQDTARNGKAGKNLKEKKTTQPPATPISPLATAEPKAPTPGRLK